MPLLDKTFIPLTAATFGDWLSPRAHAHSHKSQINTVGSNDNSFLIRLWWNLNYNTRGLPKVPKGRFQYSFISDIYYNLLIAVLYQLNYPYYPNRNRGLELFVAPNSLSLRLGPSGNSREPSSIYKRGSYASPPSKWPLITTCWKHSYHRCTSLSKLGHSSCTYRQACWPAKCHQWYYSCCGSRADSGETGPTPIPSQWLTWTCSSRPYWTPKGYWLVGTTR